MEKEIRDIDAKNRKAKYRKYFCGHENTNIAAKSVKDLKYAFMAGKNLTAKIAEDPKYALMTGKSKHAKSAKEVKYASMTGKSKHAKMRRVPNLRS